MSPFSQLSLLTVVLRGLGYPLGQVGSALLAVSPPSSLFPPSLWDSSRNKGPWIGMDKQAHELSQIVLFYTLLPGAAWLVPAEDLKHESRKENQCSAIPGPGPAWFEPWSSSKPWREPLREKNWEEQQRGVGQAAAAHPGAAEGPGQPLGKLTLQVRAPCTQGLPGPPQGGNRGVLVAVWRPPQHSPSVFPQDLTWTGILGIKSLGFGN